MQSSNKHLIGWSASVEKKNAALLVSHCLCVCCVCPQCFQCGGGSEPIVVLEAGGARAGDAACDGSQTVQDKGPGSRYLTTRSG